MLKLHSLYIKASVLYIVLPVCLALILECDVYFAALFGIVCIILLLHMWMKKERVFVNEKNDFAISKKEIAKAVIFILVIVISAGVGGYIFQNEKHIEYNSILQCLMGKGSLHEMPEGYPVGMWIIPGLLGRIFGAKFADFFLLIWVSIGVLLVFWGICLKQKRVSAKYIIIFLMFGGADFVGYMLIKGNWGLNFGELIQNAYYGILFQKIENWSNCFQFLGNGSQLIYNYGQVVVIWLILTLINLGQQKCNRYWILLIASLAMYSPIGMIVITPFVIWNVIANRKDDKIIHLLSGENILGFIVLTANMKHLDIKKYFLRCTDLKLENGGFVVICLFILLEVFIWFCINLDLHYNNVYFWMACIELTGVAFASMKLGTDFCVIAGAVGIAQLALCSIETLDYVVKTQNREVEIALIVMLCVGAVGNLNEFSDNYRNTMINHKGGISVRQETNLQMDDIVRDFPDKM